MDEEDNFVTDAYLLDYLLKKYKIDKQKLIAMIKKNRESEYKYSIMIKFYKDNKNLRKMPLHKQYKIFKNWNNSGVYITKEELDDYYQDHIKCKN